MKQVEQSLLGSDRAACLGLLGPVEQGLGKHDLLGAVALRFEASLPCQQFIEALVTIVAFASVCVSSRRIRTSPALTRSPSRTRSSPTMPPVAC